MPINCQFHSAKVAPNTNRHNFNKNLECNNFKASTLTLHVKFAKNKANCAFQKIARYIEFENFRNRVFNIVVV